MAEQFIEDIYKKSILINKIECFCERLYEGSFSPYYYTQALDDIVPELVEICKELVGRQDIAGQNVYNILKELKNQNSYVSVADKFYIDILPVVKRYIKEMPRIDVVDDDGLQLVSTDTGFLTIKNTASGIFYHSEYDPMKEARCKADILYNEQIGNYVFYGCGLGYLPYQLFLISDKSVHITIFFSTEKTYEYAKLYGVLDWIPKENIDVHVENDIIGFLEASKKYKAEYYIFQHELCNIPKEIAQLMEGLSGRQVTIFSEKRYSLINIFSNVRNIEKRISDYNATTLKNKIAVIAGGPSVNDNIQFLKDNDENISIICVGTIFKRLVSEGIQPDIVTIMDPFDSTVLQIRDVDTHNSSLFAGAFSYWKVATEYKGDKYLIPFHDHYGRENMYVNADEYVFPVCTTVTTLAFHLALYFNAEEIYLIGADYAYPDGQSHAKGTVRYTKLDTTGMIETESVTGEKVYTTEQMLSYKGELEEIISQNKNIICYNMSKKGAKIAGTKEI